MISRQADLLALEKYYEASGNQLVVLSGQLGADKETLLQSFSQNKNAFYYRAGNASVEQQKQMLKNRVESVYHISLKNDSYEEIFNRIRSKDASKLVLIIDEFQFIAKKDVTFLDHIIKLKKRKYYPGPLLIVLATSSLVFSKTDLKDLHPEFIGRVDGMLEIHDMSFLDVVRQFPKYTTSQSVQVYGIIGGVPAFVKQWDGKKTIRENICDLILSQDGYLFHAAEDYLASELRELSVYNTILASIASGHQKLNDLYEDTGFSRAKISVYMKNLMEFGVIEKVVSFETGGWDNAKKGVYQIKKTYIHFWFHFIYPHLSDLYMMRPAEFYATYIARDLEEYLNRYFIDVCREYLGLLNQIGKLPITVHRMGTWVGKQGTIDILAQDTARNSIVGICNWSKAELSLNNCEELFANMKLAKVQSNYYYLFSAKGFEQSLVDLAKDDSKYILIDMNEL